MTLTIAVRPTSLALIDEADAQIIAGWSWQLDRVGYARGFKWSTERKQMVKVYMHRLILGLTDRAIEVDHVNRDRLDNRRENLRLADRRMNCANMIRRPSASGFRGVRFEPRLKKFRAYISLYGRKVHLGVFTEIELAARAYDAAARLHHGEFAILNFPNDVAAPAPAIDVAATSALLEA